MSGVLIAGALLRVHAPLLALVPAAQIKAWALPQNMPIPSILVTMISRTELQFLAAQQIRMVTERVQVTVRAASGISRKAILDAARPACADKTGTIDGFASVAVLLAGAGPDFMDDTATTFMGSFDLRVSFNEPA